MKSIFSFLLRSFTSGIVFIITWLVAFFGFAESYWISSIVAIFCSGIIFYLLKWRENKKLLLKNQLTKKEFRYIDSNLKEAKLKIKRLNQTLLGIRSFQAVKLIGTIQRSVSRIYQIVRKEPKRFYQAERFFFYHLDSVVELSERYVFLSRQNVKEQEVRNSLAETEQTLEKLAKSLDEDLLTVLANDIETLNIELNVANKTFDLNNPNLFPDERR